MTQKERLMIVLSICFLTTKAMARGPAPDDVTIIDFVYGGTGCPAGSVASHVSEDGQAFTILFDEFIAESGPGVPFREKRKFCQLAIELDYPTGWSFALLDLLSRGYVSLDKRVKGSHKTHFYFQGSRHTGKFENKFYGPVDEDYLAEATIPVDGQIWSPCGTKRALNLKTSATLSGSRRKYGLMTVDSVDGEFIQVYGIAWRKCHGF